MAQWLCRPASDVPHPCSPSTKALTFCPERTQSASETLSQVPHHRHLHTQVCRLEAVSPGQGEQRPLGYPLSITCFQRRDWDGED